MNFLVKLFQKEKQHFERLHDQTQHLLISIFLFALISPLFGLFINAFLWRESQDFVKIAAYNLIGYFFVPFGFYLNGYLLKKFSSNHMYLFGILLQAIAAALLIYLSQITLTAVLIFGFFQGIAIGIYWANRNLLTLKTTQSDNRIYFSGLEVTSSTITRIIVPFLIGLFITSGGLFHLYTPIIAYKILAIIMLIVSAIIGMHILGMEQRKESISSLWVSSVSKRWVLFRWYEICVGFLSGIMTFLPILAVFIFVGNEKALGTIQSLSAILSAIVVYYLAKKIKVKHRSHLVALSVALCIVGALLFSLSFSAFGVFAFFAGYAIGWPILYMALSSINYDLIIRHTLCLCL
jgi:YQGE family putative transporter